MVIGYFENGGVDYYDWITHVNLLINASTKIDHEILDIK